MMYKRDIKKCPMRCHGVMLFSITLLLLFRVMVVKHKCNKILMTCLAFLLCVSLTPVTGRASVKGMPRAPHTEGAEWSLNHVFWGQLYTLYTYNLFCNWSVVLKLVLVKHQFADPGYTKKSRFCPGLQNHSRLFIRGTKSSADFCPHTVPSEF